LIPAHVIKKKTQKCSNFFFDFLAENNFSNFAKNYHVIETHYPVMKTHYPVMETHNPLMETHNNLWKPILFPKSGFP
jgi:hypothetical protein